MNWWGKVLGGAVGFWLGGPLGALIGVILGHRMDRPDDGPVDAADELDRRRSAFFTATFAVMGHLAKADGRVTADEISMARRVMDRFELEPGMRDFARQLFRAGKDPGFPLEEVLAQLAHEARSRDLKRMFLEIQVFAAYADGRMHPAEQHILARICGHLGFDRETLEQVERLVRAELGHDFSGDRGRAPTRDAYRLLGLAEQASDAEVKRAYRRLMNQHHPDKLVAKGLPEEMMQAATAKAQEIKGAYEQIKAARGMR